jgi:hypothetical protein
MYVSLSFQDSSFFLILLNFVFWRKLFEKAENLLLLKMFKLKWNYCRKLWWGKIIKRGVKTQKVTGACSRWTGVKLAGCGTRIAKSFQNFASLQSDQSQI